MDAGMKITVDDKDFQKKMTQWMQGALNRKDRAVRDIASEVLRLSQREVPHNVGTLQNSGFVDDVKNGESIVGYNTVYAARLHEHPEFKFKKGRKGKFLEDPIKNNIRQFKKYFREFVTG